MPDDIKLTEPDSADDQPATDLDLTLPPKPQTEEPLSRWQKIKQWSLSNKKVSAPICALVLVVILAVVPWTRYHLAALVINKDVNIRVLDSTAGTPVSGALVTAGAEKETTNAAGIAHFHLPVGQHNFKITKKYYSAGQQSTLVPIFKHQTSLVELVAIGRQVGIDIKDFLTGKPLSNVSIEVAGITAKTDTKGEALLVLPADVAQEQAQLSLSGYNDSKATIKISGKQIQQNLFSLTPQGKIYFLSNRTGKLNVMKANLDGSDQEVAVAATDQEQVDSSALSQSPDGKYVVLEAKRSANDATPQLYVLSTFDNQLLTFDSGNFNFSLVGWSGDSIIYKAINNNSPSWQQGKEKLKSYDASTGKTTIIDSSAGTDPDKAAHESYGEIYLTSSKVVFDKNWYSDGSDDLSDQKDTVMSVNVGGQAKQNVTSYTASTNSISMYQYAPSGFYIQVSDNSGTASYYDYSPGGSFKKIDQPANNQLYNNNQYFFSPDGSQSFWSEQRDGKENLITADTYGSSNSQKVQAAGYSAAGWYTNKYLLATNSEQNELFIMALGGKPAKVADYQSTYVY